MNRQKALRKDLLTELRTNFHLYEPSPRSKQHANNKMALIEDTMPLPALLQLRSKSYLETLYTGRHLSGQEIAGLTDLSHSVVLAAMDRFGTPQNGNGHKRQGQILFGFE